MNNSLSNDLNHILDHTNSLWDELRGASLFITGGTGFFGKWLLESLLWANDKLDLDCHVTVLTRYPDLFQSNAPHLSRHRTVSVLTGDVRTFDFPLGTFTHIIHAATDASAQLNAENPLLMLDTIVEGTRHTLDFAKACGAKKFLLTSSGAVYGKQPSDMTHTPEDYNGAPDPLDPNSAYGQGKRLAEHLCSLYADSNLEIKIARCFAFVGPYLPLDIHFAIGNFIRDAMNGGPIVIKGDGTPYRSYLYAADLAVWLWTILLRGESLRPYNVGSKNPISIAELATTVANQFQNGIKTEIQGIPDTQKPASRYVPDTQRAEKELGLQETFSLQDGINRTKDWYKLK
ncbi:MAG: NAD-dependent epimerase/dehydratase family protein [Anaerolineales bacterium]|nr:NAD-dependent epimerase/dehydratase family protein [Anaerolineales bacterium]